MRSSLVSEIYWNTQITLVRSWNISRFVVRLIVSQGVDLTAPLQEFVSSWDAQMKCVLVQIGANQKTIHTQVHQKIVCPAMQWMAAHEQGFVWMSFLRVNWRCWWIQRNHTDVLVHVYRTRDSFYGCDVVCLTSISNNSILFCLHFLSGQLQLLNDKLNRYLHIYFIFRSNTDTSNSIPED